MNFKSYTETPEIYKNILLGESVPHNSIDTKVFIDMDGVLCDLRKDVAQFIGGDPNGIYSPGDHDKFFEHYKDKIEDVFASLSPFESGNYLVQLITDVAGKFFICTAPLKSNEEDSIKGKALWMELNLIIPPEAIIYDREKFHYAQDFGKPNILIDDYELNIHQWEEAGGIGILYSANDQDLGVVVEGLEKALERLKKFS